MKKPGIPVKQKMVLSQPSIFRRVYEIHAGDTPVATLSFDGMFSLYAAGETGEHSWRFAKTGFHKPRVAVCRADTGSEVAAFQHDFWSHGGTLQFPDGRLFSGVTGRWEKDFQFKTGTGDPLVSFQIQESLALAVDIFVPRNFPDLPLFLLLGCYIVVLMHEAAVSAAGAAVIMG